MNRTELSRMCYSHIKGTFYYIILDNFKLVIDKSTGYFNATKLCSYGNKEYKIWARLERGKKLLEYYQLRWDSKNSKNIIPIYNISGAPNDEFVKQITGTYVPQELMLDIATWVSVEFYAKCNDIIMSYFAQEFESMNQTNLQNKVEQMEQQLEMSVELLYDSTPTPSTYYNL